MRDIYSILQMRYPNRNPSEREEGGEHEPLNLPVQTEFANRATGSDEEAIGVVEDDVVGADIGRDGGSGDEERGEAGTESVENVSVRRDVVR